MADKEARAAFVADSDRVMLVSEHRRIVKELEARLATNTLCKWCNDGDTPKLLDCDGTLISITGQPGTLCHAYDVYWWPCLRFGAELHTQPSLSDAIKEVEIQLDEWRRDDGSGGWATGVAAANMIIHRLKSLGPQKEG